MKPNKKEFLHFRVPSNLKETLGVVAYHEGRSLSELSREILRAGIISRGYETLLFSKVVEEEKNPWGFSLNDTK